MQDLLSAFALASFNLQRRKQAGIRIRRALNRLQSIAKQAVLFVQELGRGIGDAANLTEVHTDLPD